MMNHRRHTHALRREFVAFTLSLLCTAALLVGCQKTYYSVLESVGVEKRELLSRRVEKAKESQEEAQETFRDALDRFQQTTRYDGGELEDRYEELRDAYDDSKQQAEEVTQRIESVDDVGSALLEEWEAELEEYDNRSLRRSSSEQLATTRQNFTQLLSAMRSAERSLDPVLTQLHDQVLYLKHNLNARALESLDSRLPDLERDVQRLLEEMESSIAEANRFMAQLG